MSWYETIKLDKIKGLNPYNTINHTLSNNNNVTKIMSSNKYENITMKHV